MIKHNYGIIYCDMDGVLVDFLGGAEKVLGHAFEAPYQDKKEKFERKYKIAQTEDFWANLPLMKNSMTLWNYINKYNAHILTAYADWDDNSRKGKRDWVEKHLHLPLNRFHAVARDEKKDYATSGNKQNILIDDYEKNIKEFNAAGGIGIHHVNIRVTIRKLKELGFK
jgi:FMN phosphatase YigB (HAD superfamily)